MARIQRPAAGETSAIIKPGEYPAIVVESQASTSSNGNPMLILTFEVEVKSNSRRRLKSWVPLHVSHRVAQLYSAFPKAIDDEGFLDSDLIEGERCYVDIINEDYQGKKTDKVKDILVDEDAAAESSIAVGNRTVEVEADDCPF